MGVFLVVLAAQAETTTITYQGQLRQSGAAFSGTATLQFRLYAQPSGGPQIGSPQTRTNVSIQDGLFQVELDYDPSFFDGERYLEIRINGDPLVPRQRVTATPYALVASATAEGAVGAASVDASEVQLRVDGSCPLGQSIRVVNQNGTVVCEEDSDAGGTLTQIDTGVGLQGGPITESGTVSIAPGGVGTTQINAGQVQRRITGTCPAGQSIRSVNQDGTVLCEIDDQGEAGWGLNGNTGTNPATDFIGTIDATALELRTASVRSLWLEPSVQTFNGAPITANVIAGSSANGIAPGVRGATIAGGGAPTGDSDPDFPAEAPNRVLDHYGAIGGGFGNQAGDEGSDPLIGPFSTVGGGALNVASGSYSTVGGGGNNLASNYAAVVSGGVANWASANSSAVSGGQFNIASGFTSTVGGGQFNDAAGAYSFVVGRRAKNANADHDGVFMFADSQDTDLVSTGPNQFLVRAEGGTGINTNAPDAPLHVFGPSRRVSGDFGQIIAQGEEETGAAGTGGIISFLGHDGDDTERVWGLIENVKENSTVGDVRSRMSFFTRGGSGLPIERMRIDSNGATFNVSGAWSIFSDRRLKRDIEPLIGALDQLLELEGTRFEYTDSDSVMRHSGPRIGFIAQQVEEVFPEWVSEDPRGYKFVTATGFDALMVEALRDLRGEKDQSIAGLVADNAQLRQQIAALQSRQDAELAELRTELELMRELFAPRLARETTQ